MPTLLQRDPQISQYGVGRDSRQSDDAAPGKLLPAGLLQVVLQLLKVELMQIAIKQREEL